ncbi:AraC-like DNA-binding protein [Fluviicoccus keumensis]|uniref:AraC-like DNA-binding protein n=1 Tax=Fluviicoccus keumensis TaxID=1435465 RepID=A0A4V2G325_9GAMM|nr:AraC family transcriptional regulator [Fluviicoccus keumensis]RZU35396.1 AraC-like DNA-binding protein [Fluviicoccus keumensis]
MQELPFVPVIYLLKLVELMEEEHLRTDVILRECGISQSLLSKPEVYLSVHQSRAVMQKFLGLTSLSQPGIRYGYRLDMLTHGLFGFVFLFRGNFHDLMDQVVGYMRVRMPLIKLDIRHEPDFIGITVDCALRQPEVEAFLTQTILGSYYKLGSLVTRNVTLHVRPGIFTDTRNLQTLLPIPIQFDHPVNEIRFHVSEAGAATEKPQPTDESEAIETDLPGIVVRLRQYILSHVGEPLATEDAASHLGMSERTLRRRLAEGGHNYHQIRLDVRMSAALRYLQTSHLSIERIAGIVGYSDQATFSRAFLKWHGETPDAARRKTLKQYVKKNE